jgi:hypothetical protein
MKKLEVKIDAYDSDHVPPSGAQTYSVVTNVPWLTAGRIALAIENVLRAEGCKLKLDSNNFVGQEDQSEKQIHLIVTPQQATGLAVALKLVKEIFDMPPNTPLYSNLRGSGVERELVKAEVNATQEALLKQLEEQMPKE